MNILKPESQNSKECSNLEEPQFNSKNCIETEIYQDLNIGKKSPESIYLDYCQNFTSQNLHLETWEIKGYQKDMPQRIFTEIIENDKISILVVKTFEQISKTEYVKTIQFLSNLAQPLCSPILVETFDQPNILEEVSIAQFQNKVYYFKKEWGCFQLYSFETETNQEQKIEGYQIEGLNLIFSKQFGENGKCPADEDQFLRSQYVLIQGQDQISIKQLGKETPKQEIKNFDLVFQSLHHIILTPKVVHFVAQNALVNVQITADSVEIFPRTSKDLCVKLQKQQLKNGIQIFNQYYYVDCRNRVQLMYPNYNLLLKRTQITDSVAQMANLKEIDPKQYKRINNFVQKIGDLEKILNFKGIKQEDKFNFCNQKLYLTNQKSNLIRIWWLKKQVCRAQNSQEIIENNILKKIEQKFVSNDEEDHQNEEYVSYRVQRQEQGPDQGQQDQGEEFVEIKAEEKDNHVFLDNQGVKVKVMTYQKTKFMDETCISLLLYQPTQFSTCFVFAIFNSEIKIESNSDHKKTVKKSFFFITKTSEEMNKIIEGQNPIINKNQNVQMLKSNKKIEEIKIDQIKEYQFCGDKEYTDIKLNFMQEKDVSLHVNFIPFIYQDKTVENNDFLIYDIFQKKLSEPKCINPPTNSLKYIYEDEQGYNCFSLCRTSDVSNEPSKCRKKKFKGFQRQTSKYQLFTLMSENVGIILCDEFLITHDLEGSILQPIGKKQIMLSKKSQQTFFWSLLKNFTTIPYKDEKKSIKGCQLVIQTSKFNWVNINLLDQDQNNLYNYQSEIVLVGHKKFQMSEDSDVYAMVISTVLRREIITKKIFDNYEVEKILYKAIELTLGMRIPDLEFIVLNRFEDHVKKCYFQTQELLHFKSIGDFFIWEQMGESLAKYNAKDESNLQGSIFEQMTWDDQVRKDLLHEIGFAPKVLIIQKDLNFTCTIERALLKKKYYTASNLLNHIIKTIENASDYQHLLMSDLPIILNNISSISNTSINDFFQSSKGCNIERNFQNPEVPVFSDKLQEYIVANDFSDIHDHEQELINKIVQRDKTKSVKNFVITHTYVDFRELILGEKLRSYKKQKKGLRFDNKYYAEMMMKCGDENLEFYLQESVQKLIDYQWSLTKGVMICLFLIYVLLFLFPLCATLYTDDEWVHTVMVEIASGSAVLFLLIELIQMGKQGLSYFMGWNLIDISLIVVFSLVQLFFFMGQDHTLIIMPELKLLLIIIAFIKLLFFIRIFEDFGFLVQMILLCVYDLIPFIISYLIFLILFTVCFVVLDMEIDPEVEEAENMTYFQKMLLQTFRTAIGELGMPVYPRILHRPPSIVKTVNITLIWICWFSMTFFMLVIMMNFLIAVITSTYEKAINYQKIISYMHKAELNLEVFQLTSFFWKMQEYRFIVFSNSKQAGTLEDDQFVEVVDLLMKFINKENKEIKGSEYLMREEIAKAKEEQEEMMEQLEDRFEKIEAKQANAKKEIIDEILEKYQ